MSSCSWLLNGVNPQHLLNHLQGFSINLGTEALRSLCKETSMLTFLNYRDDEGFIFVICFHVIDNYKVQNEIKMHKLLQLKL